MLPQKNAAPYEAAFLLSMRTQANSVELAGGCYLSVKPILLMG
jgi:hypothetical protein